jgi:hypothetical protein
MLLTVILFLVSGLGFGVFMGFPALIPLFRRRGRQHERFRRYLTRGLALLAALLFFVSGAFTLGTSYVRSVNCAYSAVEDGLVCEQVDIPGGDTETILQTLLPPFLRGTCLTGNVPVCEALQTQDVFTGHPQWLDYLSLLTGSLLAAAVCAFFIHHQLKPPSEPSQRRT